MVSAYRVALELRLECIEVATTVEVKSEAPVPTSHRDRLDLEPTNTGELAANNLRASHADADWRFLRKILLTRLFLVQEPRTIECATVLACPSRKGVGDSRA